MKLKNPSIATEASRLLQEIENEVNLAGIQHTAQEAIEPKVRFPRGYIREAGCFRQKYPCHKRPIANNVAYTLQFHDVLRWLLNRTDIDLTARQMVIKYGIVSIYSVIEAIVWTKLSQTRNMPGKKFEKNVGKMQSSGFIDQGLAKRLIDVHKKRGKIHLELYALKGEEKYDHQDWNNAVEALEDLRKAVAGD